MKRNISILFLFIFAVSFISAAGAEIKLEKQEFYPNELLKAEILGTFPEGLRLENIEIFENGKIHSVPVESRLIMLDTKYLYYAVLPSLNESYSLKIKNAKYYVGQETSSAELTANFTVTNTDKPYLSINKGFISTTSDFSITVKSLNGVQEVVAKFDATGEEKKVSIGQNADKTLTFSIAGIKEYTESSLVINSYTIPVYVSPIRQGETPFINETETQKNDTNKTTEPEQISLEEATQKQIQTCADISGKLCKESETCEGPTSWAKDVVCCMGTCKEKPKSKAWIGGVIILIILVLGAWWFYARIKKGGKPKSGKYDLEESSERFRERMYPKSNTELEVRRKLIKE